MILRANIKEATRSLYSSKQRTVLALIGIIIGIGSVIAMVSIGKIVQTEALRQFVSMGTNILTIRKDSVGGGRDSSLQMKDVFDIPSKCPAVINVAPFILGSGSVSYRGKKIDGTAILGATESLSDLNKLSVKKGRFLSDLDEYSQYCVLGNSVAHSMMTSGGGEVIGRNLKIDNRIFTVIGYLEEISAGGLRSFDPNGAIFVHLTTLLRVQGNSEISNVLARVREGTANFVAKEQVNEFFGRHTKIKDIVITSPEEMVEQMEKQMKLYTLLLGAIGSISLIVGGVGVMNVMLVSVAERRREIGIRRALGAKRTDIKSQFLMESVILSLVGGVLGILLGLGVSFALAHFAKWQFSVSYGAILLGFGVSSVVGIFFGYYPARQASKLDPIIALRSD